MVGYPPVLADISRGQRRRSSKEIAAGGDHLPVGHDVDAIEFNIPQDPLVVRDQIRTEHPKRGVRIGHEGVFQQPASLSAM